MTVGTALMLPYREHLPGFPLAHPATGGSPAVAHPGTGGSPARCPAEDQPGDDRACDEPAREHGQRHRGYRPGARRVDRMPVPCLTGQAEPAEFDHRVERKEAED